MTAIVSSGSCSHRLSLVHGQRVCTESCCRSVNKLPPFSVCDASKKMLEQSTMRAAMFASVRRRLFDGYSTTSSKLF
jgi:hypothetical protein